jgi:hypothetical protein
MTPSRYRSFQRLSLTRHDSKKNALSADTQMCPHVGHQKLSLMLRKIQRLQALTAMWRIAAQID